MATDTTLERRVSSFLKWGGGAIAPLPPSFTDASVSQGHPALEYPASTKSVTTVRTINDIVVSCMVPRHHNHIIVGKTALTMLPLNA